MKKSLVLTYIILFATAISAYATKNPTSQTPNTSLDSLKKMYSYEVCKQYLFFNQQNHSTNELTTSFPIVRFFPQYFEPISSKIIWPDYTCFTSDYGCPIRIRVKKENQIHDLLAESRQSLDSVSKVITNIFYSDSIYRRIATDKTLPDLEKNNLLKKEEKRIRMTASEIIYTDSPKRTDFYHQAGKYYKIKKVSPYENYRHEYNNGEPVVNNFRVIKNLNRRKQYISYLNHYCHSLQQANLASLSVILSDHIRRGVPIDISWIPEETLAEIDATKPVRQLKKQIKTLEKQTKQP